MSRSLHLFHAMKIRKMLPVALEMSTRKYLQLEEKLQFDVKMYLLHFIVFCIIYSQVSLFLIDLVKGIEFLCAQFGYFGYL